MAHDNTVTAPDGSEVQLGEVGTSIVLENEHVRVWEVRLEPGETQAWHLHHHPYLVIAIEPANNRMDFLDGDPPREMDETVGRVVYREAGKVHMLTNRGQTRYVNRLIELKSVDETVEVDGDGR